MRGDAASAIPAPLGPRERFGERPGVAEVTVRPAVVACTLLPYDPKFDLGHSLEETSGEVWLNRPHCARFRVLGGGSCSTSRCRQTRALPNGQRRSSAHSAQRGAVRRQNC